MMLSTVKHVFTVRWQRELHPISVCELTVQGTKFPFDEARSGLQCHSGAMMGLLGRSPLVLNSQPSADFENVSSCLIRCEYSGAHARKSV